MFSFGFLASISVAISSVAFVVLEPTFKNSFQLTDSDEWSSRISSRIGSDELKRASAEKRNTESAGTDQVQNAIIDIIDEIERKYSLEVWQEVKTELNQQLRKLMNCGTARCRNRVDQSIAGNIESYFVQIGREYPEVVQEIAQELIVRGLLGHPVFPNNKPIDATPSNDTTDYAGILECLIDVCRNVTAEYELTQLWASHATAFDMYLKNIRECDLNDYYDAEDVEICYGGDAYAEFMTLLNESNVEAAEKMTRMYNSVCVDGAAKKQKLLELKSIEREQNRLICVMNAIDKVISATELNELWQTYKTNLLEARIRWNKCKELRTAGDVAKCSAAEASNVEGNIRGLFHSMSISNGNDELIEKIRVQTRTDCNSN